MYETKVCFFNFQVFGKISAVEVLLYGLYVLMLLGSKTASQFQFSTPTAKEGERSLLYSTVKIHTEIEIIINIKANVCVYTKLVQ